MKAVRTFTEALARTTSRRGFFGRGAQLATGVLMGAAAGSVLRPESALGGVASTVCAFPGPPCTCEQCSEGGVCSKPCVLYPFWYSSGCWVTNGVTCCDCDCPPFGAPYCGCGSDYHNNPAACS
jgi:hypothetical protein